MVKRIYSLAYCSEEVFRKYCSDIKKYKNKELIDKPFINKVDLDINSDIVNKFSLAEIDFITAGFKNEKSFLNEFVPKGSISKNKKLFLIYQSNGVRDKEIIYDSNFIMHVANDISNRKNNGEIDVLVDYSDEVEIYLDLLFKKLFSDKHPDFYFNKLIIDKVFNIKNSDFNNKSFDHCDVFEEEKLRRDNIAEVKKLMREYSNFRSSFFYAKSRGINIDSVLYKEDEKEIVNDEMFGVKKEIVEAYADAKGITYKEAVKRMEYSEKNNNQEEKYEQLNLFDLMNKGLLTNCDDKNNGNFSFVKSKML